MKHGIYYVAPLGRFARSVNVERDAGRSGIDTFLPTGRALDVVSRIARCLNTEPRTRAFSITGPYGTGKSSLAVFVDALLGPADETSTSTALGVLAAVDPASAALVENSKLDLGSGGFVRAGVTASREPVAATLVRALLQGMDRFNPSRPTKAWRQLRKDLAGSIEEMESENRLLPTTRFIKDSLSQVSSFAPVLLIIDEFGKNLEAFADSTSEADLFLLQELVEWSHTPPEGCSPVIIITMQHLAFGEYLDTVSQSLRQDWAKVHGRFEDIPYLDTPAQTHYLIGQVNEAPTNVGFIEKRSTWTTARFDELKQAGLSHELDQALIEPAWPLHPIALYILPELCARYGQNERTLFSFLASSEPYGVAAWLSDTPVGASLADIRLDRVYDYFVSAASTSAGTSQTASRWVEVETAVRDSTGLSEAERRVLKAVGLLNLVSAGGTARASRQVLRLACADGQLGTEDHDAVDRALVSLEEAGRITYREFADEFRLWRGSDLDLRSALESARRALRQMSSERLLAETREMFPIVAARHSTKTGTLRVFERIWDSDGEITQLNTNGGADGLLVYVVGEQVPRLRASNDARPVVAIRPNNVEELLGAALELASIRTVMRDEEVIGDDWVAKRELAEREAEALTMFDSAFEKALGHRANGAQWWILGTGNGTPERLTPELTVTGTLSKVCDSAYSSTPPVPNEMLNRHELTSQGAKARRLLIEAMLGSVAKERLGIDGFPPERAMYDAVLGSSGIHREIDGRFQIVEPTAEGWGPTWDALLSLFDEAKSGRLNLERALIDLSRPPIGLKAGVGPVLLVAGIIANRDEIALYEHGTYRPRLTSEIAERLVRNPAHFEVKHFAATSGARRHALEALAEQLSVRSWKNASPTVLSVVSHLVGQINALTPYGRQTRNLSDEAIAVRRALIEATEPDVILFETMPALFGLENLPSTARKSKKEAAEYGRELGRLLEERMAELRNIQSGLLQQVEHSLIQATRSHQNGARQELRGRATRIKGKVLDVHLRGLLAALSDELKDDAGWLEYVAMVVCGPPPSTWGDSELLQYETAIKDLGGKLRRIEAIYVDELAADGEPFKASRYTVTRSDGTERGRVVLSDDRVLALHAEGFNGYFKELAKSAGGPEAAVDVILSMLDEVMFIETHDELSKKRDTVTAAARQQSDEGVG